LTKIGVLTVVVKCKSSICGFSQGLVVLRRGLQDGFGKRGIVFMCGQWLISMQGVW